MWLSGGIWHLDPMLVLVLAQFRGLCKTF